MPRYHMKREAGQTVDEMAAQLEENSGRNRINRLYPDASAEVKREALAAVVNQQRELLHMTKERGRRINLDDVDEVEKCATDYMEACIRSNVYPSMLNFSAATGWSRKHIYKYIQTHNNESAHYLDNLRSSWASIMAQMALNRHASEAVSIFLLKNSGQDLADKVELTAIPQMPERELTAEEIAQRYLTDRTDEGSAPCVFPTNYTERTMDNE